MNRHMKRCNIVRMLFCTLVTTALMACESDVLEGFDTSETSKAWDEELCDFNLMMRAKSGAPADYKSTTYRAQLFYQNQSSSPTRRFDMMYSPYCGTYCDPKDDSGILTPCKVDDTNFGYDNEEGAKYGLRGGVSNSYYLLLNSPATKYEYLYTTDTIVKVNNKEEIYHFYHWGMPYLRDSRSNGSAEDLQKDHPYICDPIKVGTMGATIDGAFSYTIPQTTILNEHRSRMAFSIRCGAAVRSAKIKRISISGLRKKAWYLPFDKAFYFDPDNETARGEYEDIVIYENPDGLEITRTETDRGTTVGKSWSISSPSSAEVLTAGTKTNNYLTYILSDDYISRDVDNTYYLNEPPCLNITMIGQGGSEVHIDPIPLALNYDSQTNYYWLITISKIYVTAEVTKVWGELVNIAQEDQNITVDDYTDGYHKVVHEVGDWTAMLNDGEGDASIDPGTGDPIAGTGTGNPLGWHDENNTGDTSVDPGSNEPTNTIGSGSAGNWEDKGSNGGEISGDGNNGATVTGLGAAGDWTSSGNTGSGSVDAGAVINTGSSFNVQGGVLYTLRVNHTGKQYKLTCNPENVLYINMSGGPNYTSVTNGGNTPVLVYKEYTVYFKSDDQVTLTGQ